MTTNLLSPPAITVSYPSLASLRAVHNDLLALHRQEGNAQDALVRASAFIEQGRATGAVLDVEEDRWAAQGLLDYWSAILYRTGIEPPDATLFDFDPELAPELPDDLVPYVGLDAFSEAKQAMFRGRQRLAETLLDALKENRLLAVVGPSGSGKSSLVLAGLIPDLKEGALPASQTWRYAPRLVPGSNPLSNLARLIQTLRGDAGDAPTEETQQEVEFLRRDATYLVRLASETGDAPLVLVVDQFEEVFTLCSDDAVREAFVANVAWLAQAPGPRHTVILTMRTDFESFIARLPDFEPLFEQALVRVTPLNAAELREAIEGPAEMIGLKFEAGLVDILLQDILGEPAALPLLQFTLLKLWQQRERNYITWEAYHHLEGGRLALATSADDFYDGLILEEQLTARRILLRLVRPGEGLEVTSNRVRRDALYKAGEARDRIDRVLGKLIEARLVRLTEGDIAADAQVEIAHEALVRNWPRLIEWVEEDREMIRRRQRLADATEHWVVLGRDPGALLSVTLLHEAQRTLDLSGVDLSDLETEYLQASQTAIDAEREREVARQIELRQAQREAETQAKKAHRLRLVAAGLALLLMVPVAAVIVELRQRESAWQPLESFPRDPVVTLAVSEAGKEAATTYCAGTTNIGIGCSQGGRTWNIYQQDLPTGDPAYVGGSGFAGATRGVQAVSIDAFNPNRIFAFLWDGHMYKSETGGLRWQDVSTGLPTDGASAESIAIKGDLALAVLNERLYSSTDGGQQWAAAGEDSAPFWGRVHQVKIMPGSRRAYVGTDNGLYRGTYGPPWQWTRLVDLPSVTIIAPVAGDGESLYLATYDESRRQSTVYHWQPDQRRRLLATFDQKIDALTADPNQTRGTAVYALLNSGEVVAVTQDGSKHSLGRRPGWPWDQAFDLLAVANGPDSSPTLLLGHTDGLLIFPRDVASEVAHGRFAASRQ